MRVLDPAALDRAARLDWELGRLLRVTERTWPGLRLGQRRKYVDEFIRLEATLRDLTGKPDITSPWTGLELASSMLELPNGSFYTGDALSVESSPLMVAVRRTKTTLAKTGCLPASLNSKRVPVPGFGRIDHAYSVEDVQRMRVQAAPPLPGGKPSASEQGREWITKAEARLLPR